MNEYIVCGLRKRNNASLRFHKFPKDDKRYVKFVCYNCVLENNSGICKYGLRQRVNEIMASTTTVMHILVSANYFYCF